MRDPARIPDMLRRLEKVWSQNPDFRLGQLMANVTEERIFFIEDEELMEGLEANAKRFARV
jgi:uncharacterized protein YihD (DUF1040 family)